MGNSLGEAAAHRGAQRHAKLLAMVVPPLACKSCGRLGVALLAKTWLLNTRTRVHCRKMGNRPRPDICSSRQRRLHMCSRRENMKWVGLLVVMTAACGGDAPGDAPPADSE